MTIKRRFLDIMNADEDDGNVAADGGTVHVKELGIDINLPNQTADTDDEIADVDDNDDEADKGPNAAEALRARVNAQIGKMITLQARVAAVGVLVVLVEAEAGVEAAVVMVKAVMLILLTPSETLRFQVCCMMMFHQFFGFDQDLDVSAAFFLGVYHHLADLVSITLCFFGFFFAT